MATKVPLTQGSDIEPVPAGLQKSVCVGVIILGTIFSEQFGKASKKMILKWELPELPPIEFEKDGKVELLPRVLTKEFTFSMHPKGNLRPTIEGWFGKALSDDQADGFDVSDLLGQECMMQIIHESKQEKTYARIKAIMPLPQNTQIEYQTMSEPVLFDVDEHVSPDGSFLIELPEWLQKKVKTSEEYKAKTKLPSNRELGHQPVQRQPAPQQRHAPTPAQAARPVARPQTAAPRPPQQQVRQPMQQPARRQQPQIDDNPPPSETSLVDDNDVPF